LNQNILGIDISKDTFNVTLIGGKNGKASTQFANSPKGYHALMHWLHKQKAPLIWAAMEATGRYWEKLAICLHKQGQQVSVINPKRIKRYAQSKLLRNKTDKLDASLIADFCRTQTPYLWEPPREEMHELQMLTRRLKGLIESRTREENRRQAGDHSSFMENSFKEMIEYINNKIQEVEIEIEALIEAYLYLKEMRDLILTIPGIGKKTAARILGEVGDISRFKDAKALIAYAGLSPERCDSGTSVHKPTRLTKTGNRALKSALFFPALAALRFNPIIKALAERLKEKNKPKMVIVGAAMRKLLRLVYGVLKTKTPFDPSFIANQQIGT